MRRKLFGLVVAALTVVGLAGCGTAEAAPAPAPQKIETMSMSEAGEYYQQLIAPLNEKINAYSDAVNSGDVLTISETAGAAAKASQKAADDMRAKQWPEKVQKYADATADDLEALAPLYKQTSEIATITEIDSIWSDYVSNGASITLRKALGLKSAQEATAAKIGDTQTNGSLELTVKKVAQQATINYDTCENSCSSGTYAPKSAHDGQQYFVASVVVKNNSNASIDITCGYPLKITAANKEGARFDPIESLYQVQGNPGCNDGLQPGQSADVVYPFEIGSDVAIESLVWQDMTYLEQGGSQPPAETYYSVN